VSTESSEDSTSSDSSSTPSVDSRFENSTTTLGHSHGNWHGRYHHTSESSYSGTYSYTSGHPYTGLSNSYFTSQKTGEASTVSTVSFEQKQYLDTWANLNPGAKVELLEDEDVDEFANINGVEWIGDVDNEIIFGTAWLDVLQGGYGNDNLYGFEGNDYITGGDGADSIFGDGGDDRIYTGFGP